MTSTTPPPVTRHGRKLPGLPGAGVWPAWLQALLIVGAAALPAALTGGAIAPPPPEVLEDGTRIARVSVAEAKALDQVLWLDARPRKDFVTGHISGALPLSEEAWETDLVGVLMAWNPGDTVVVYCSTAACGTSTDVARRLVAATDLQPVVILDGGWEAYLGPGNPEDHGARAN